ncbi:hypothetical protein DF3PB_1230004 [uncultured Defluviicoccus sp.]|uniref:Uncharacterized protein n=1 Tax=metagenome TaxID=256318 RepID=A0A380TAQ9_9ZZZZ|nr:hypothetical protein DF3PB_1230004 [uncultured Defluviicoccus sp.]
MRRRSGPREEMADQVGAGKTTARLETQVAAFSRRGGPVAPFRPEPYISRRSVYLCRQCQPTLGGLSRRQWLGLASPPQHEVT